MEMDEGEWVVERQLNFEKVVIGFSYADLRPIYDEPVHAVDPTLPPNYIQCQNPPTGE